MTRDFPNLPRVDNQPISQQSLILRKNSENMKNSFLDVQPVPMNVLPQFPDIQHPYPDMQQTFAQQALPNAEHLLSDPQQPLLDLDMQQTFAQQALPNAEHLLSDPQQPLLDLDMQQTFAQQALPNAEHLLSDPQQPLLDLDMQQTFAQQALPDTLQFFPDAQDLLLAPDMQQTFAQQPIPDVQAHQSRFGQMYNGPLRSDYLLHRQPNSSPMSPFAKLAYLWRSDPAYKVFFLALATVLISGLVCLAIINNMVKGPSSSQGSAHQTTGMSTTPTNIPTPMPIPTPTPTLTPTIEPTTPPAPPPTPLQLTVGITSIPSAVVNNTTTSIGVTTNEPGVTVALYVTYSGATPSTFKGTARTTDSNGQITLPWHVSVHSSKRSSNVTAHVTVYAQDTNGQDATSQTATVQVFTFQLG